MDVQIDTGNLKVLEDFFRDLSVIDQKKIFIAGFRRAAKPLINRAKSDSPIGHNKMLRSGKLHEAGTLMRSFGTVEVPDEITLLIGAKRSGKYRGAHGHLIEEGTAPRQRIKWRGKPLKTGPVSTGMVIGTHFFENAFNMTKDEMFGNIEEEWHNAIEKFIINTNKKLK